MAAETSSVPVNGNYASHPGLGGAEHQNNYAYSNNNVTGTAQAPPQPPPTSTTPASTTSQAELSKDEVGWYFVEQYYTTLSRNPERLYLFYNKRSQFVSGQEADKVRVYGGQTAINNRIKELEFKDCKVRVTNVDAQASESNIVIQVIGEMSNKSQPHKKFVQTFVLATQTNGYFVLNDIFRYLVDEEDELEPEGQAPLEDVQQAPVADSAFQEPPPTPREGEQKTMTSSDDPVQVEQDAQELDRELEEKVLQEPEEKLPAAVNGVAESEAAVQVADDAPAAAVAPAAPVAPVALETPKEVADKPTEPAPIPSPPKQATPQPAPVSKPAAPKTWASMAASANKVATPVSLSTAATPDSQQARSTAASTKAATPPASAPSAAPTAPAASVAQREEPSGDAGQGDEWTAVGSSHARQQSRQTAYPQQEGPPTRVYIKNVNENVSTSELKSHLEKYGDFVYFDRPGQKNFVQAEYRTPEAFAAAFGANPHTVNGERILVEARRPFQRGGFQGARGRGNLDASQARGNFAGRGGFSSRGRGGNAGTNSPRGRGGPPQAA